MALEEAYATMDFSGEKILYEGPPSTGDLITNVALGITVLWLVRHYPPTGIRLNANRLGFGDRKYTPRMRHNGHTCAVIVYGLQSCLILRNRAGVAKCPPNRCFDYTTRLLQRPLNGYWDARGW